jgi:hypothetical protein
LPRLIITLKAIVLAIDTHLAAKSQRVNSLRPVQDRSYKVATDGSELIGVAIANGRTCGII